MLFAFSSAHLLLLPLAAAELSPPSVASATGSSDTTTTWPWLETSKHRHLEMRRLQGGPPPGPACWPPPIATCPFVPLLPTFLNQIVTSGAGMWPHDIRTADMNGDGCLDVLVGVGLEVRVAVTDRVCCMHLQVCVFRLVG